MGGPNPDRWPAEAWRVEAETVAEMAAKGWDVISKCPLCGLVMQTNLKLIVRVSGPGISLWNRRDPCRRMGCTGRVQFHGRPPGIGRHLLLEAEWPKHKPRHPPGRR